MAVVEFDITFLIPLEKYKDITSIYPSDKLIIFSRAPVVFSKIYR